jgi:DNA-binding LytR/AlgR family response regulator
MLVENEKEPRFKTRLLVQKGVEFIALKIEDIVLLYTENRLVYALDKNEKKYIVNKKLNQLEEELNTKTFFRANRQCIISINFIRSFRTYERVKLAIDLSLTNFKFPVIISQENAANFRKWISEAE